MNVTKSSMNVKLSDSQVNDLARPLMEILEAFYKDPKNEEDFQRWLLSVEKNNQKSNATES